MKKIILGAVILFSLGSNAQIGGLINKAKGKSGNLELFKEEELTGNFGDIQKKYVGKVVFSNSEIEREDPESEYITTYTLGDKLFLRGFYEHSVSNSILTQLLESGMKAKDIKSWKDGFESQTRLITKLYFDGKFIASVGREKYLNGDDATKLILSMRGTLNDGTDKLWEGEIMYQELLSKQELLTPGKHKLKIEQIPLKTFGEGSEFEYKPIAVGEIDVIVPAVMKVNESDCFPKKELSDPILEKEVMNACKSYFTNDGTITLLKAILTFKDIYIIRDEYGQIIKKSFMATIVYKNGNVVGYDYFIFDKAYDGSKYLPATIAKGITLNGYTAPDGKKVNKDCLKYLK